MLVKQDTSDIDFLIHRPWATCEYYGGGGGGGRWGKDGWFGLQPSFDHDEPWPQSLSYMKVVQMLKLRWVFFKTRG